MREFIFIQLLVAHLVADFILPPWKRMKEKGRPTWQSRRLLLHAVLHFVTAYVLMFDAEMWHIAAFIGVSHYVGDLIRYQWQHKYPVASFVIDQVFHLCIIAAIWWGLNFQEPGLFTFSVSIPFYELAGLLFVTKPAAVIVQLFLSRWPASKEIAKNKGLVNAGQWIGVLERMLAFIFILVGHWEAVGFLLAAKSVFRFGDLRHSKEVYLTEYILMGTLLSFTIAILTALLVLTYTTP